MKLNKKSLPEQIVKLDMEQIEAKEEEKKKHKGLLSWLKNHKAISSIVVGTALIASIFGTASALTNEVIGNNELTGEPSLEDIQKHHDRQLKEKKATDIDRESVCQFEENEKTTNNIERIEKPETIEEFVNKPTYVPTQNQQVEPCSCGWIILQNLQKQKSYITKTPTENIIKVWYDAKDIENRIVVVTINSEKEIKEIEGWTLSKNKKTLSKIYNENIKENVIITDLEGNEFAVKINVMSIHPKDNLEQVEETITDIDRESVCQFEQNKEPINVEMIERKESSDVVEFVNSVYFNNNENVQSKLTTLYAMRELIIDENVVDYSEYGSTYVMKK